MRTEEEIREKIEELEDRLDELDDEFQETLEDEDIDEFSPQGEDLELKFEEKKQVVEEQIDLLEWVLEE